MAELGGIIAVASSNTYYFTNACNNDMLIYPETSNQQIRMGLLSNAPAVLTVNSNNLQVTGDLRFTGNLLQNGIVYSSGVGFSNFGSNLFILGSNIAIGKSNATYPLDVLGDINFNGILRQGGVPYIGSQWSNNNSNVFLLTSNVGIGKSNPAFPLDVLGDMNFTGTLRQGGIPYIGSQWSNNSSNVFLLTSNVGIGKSNPAYPLDVTGDINFNGILRQGGVPYIGSQWSNLSSNIFIIGSNIAIGKSNATATLDVAGTLAISGVITVASNIVPLSNLVYDLGTSNMRFRSIYLASNTIDLGGTLITVEGGTLKVTDSNNSNVSVLSQRLQLGASSNTAIVLTGSNGNLGINNPNPLTTVDIIGTTSFRGNIQMNNSVAIRGLTISKRDGTMANITTSSIQGLSNDTAGILLSVNSNNSNTAFRFQGNTTEVVRITGEGNVGIGKSNPAFPLDVLGDINFNGTLRQGGIPYVVSQWSNNNSNVFLLTSNVGIGKSNPAFPLDVLGDLNFTGLLRQNNNPYNIGSQWSNNSSNVFLLQSNVGIGTITPSNLLTVAGRASIGESYCNVLAPLNGLIVQGNVGIGTANPQAPLSIVGNIQTTGYIYKSTGSISISNATPASWYRLITTSLGESTKILITLIAPGIHERCIINYTQTYIETINMSIESYANRGSQNMIQARYLTNSGNGAAYMDIFISNNYFQTFGFILSATILNSDSISSTIASNIVSTSAIIDSGYTQIGILNIRPFSTSYNNNIFLMNSNGNVGIGTSTPASILHIQCSNNQGINITSIDTGGFANNGLFLNSWNGTQSNIASIALKNTAIDRSIQFFNNSTLLASTDVTYKFLNSNANTTQLAILGNGNVGIGTLTPQSLLDVNGVITVLDGGSRTLYGGISTEVNSQLINFGINDSRFGIQNNTYSGGLIRLDSRASSSTSFIQFCVRPAGSSVNPPTVMVISQNGNVGIGTTAPSYPLHVTSFSTPNLSGGYYFGTGTSTLVANAPGGNQSSIYAAQWISSATGFIAASDRRIKNILSSNDNDLDLINKIDVVKYKYKDQLTKGLKTNIGYIAQQVKEYLPDAVNYSTEFIPDIYKVATLSNNIITLNDHNLTLSTKIKLINKSGDINGFNAIIKKIIDVNNFIVECDEKLDNQIFVYGREVDDFHNLNYDMLSALAFNGVKELYKLHKEKDIEIDNLKSSVTKLTNFIKSKFTDYELI